MMRDDIHVRKFPHRMMAIGYGSSTESAEQFLKDAPLDNTVHSFYVGKLVIRRIYFRSLINNILLPFMQTKLILQYQRPREDKQCSKNVFIAILDSQEYTK